MRAGSHYEKRRIDDPAKDPAIGQTEDGRPIEDHTIVMARKTDQ